MGEAVGMKAVPPASRGSLEAVGIAGYDDMGKVSQESGYPA